MRRQGIQTPIKIAAKVEAPEDYGPNFFRKIDTKY